MSDSGRAWGSSSDEAIRARNAGKKRSQDPDMIVPPKELRDRWREEFNEQIGRLVPRLFDAIDFQESVLRKYILYVAGCEGVNFLRDSDKPDGWFSDEEWAFLQKMR